MKFELEKTLRGEPDEVLLDDLRRRAASPLSQPGIELHVDHVVPSSKGPTPLTQFDA